jgi:hypothetical protein
MRSGKKSGYVHRKALKRRKKGHHSPSTRMLITHIHHVDKV